MNHCIRSTLAILAAFALLVLFPAPGHPQSYQFTKISGDGFSDFGAAAINDQGTVAFRGQRTSSGVTGIFLGRGGRLITIADDSRRFNFIGRNPSLNDHGEVSFAATLRSGGEAIFRGVRGRLTVIAETAMGPFNFFAFDTSLDDNGSGGPLTTVVNSSGPFSSFGDPSLNDNDIVAFSAFLDGGEQGLFVGPDPVADRVIQTGDALDGSIVINLGFSREGLNNGGQLAFLAQLADGRTAIFRAAPVP